MQLKAFEMSVKRAPDLYPLSITFLNFPNITKRQQCELKPFRNPH